MEVVEPVASKVGEWLVPLVVRHCGYLIRSDRYVRELNEEVEKLENAKQRVQHSIAEAERNFKGIEADVKKWMEDAKDATKKPMEDAENATKMSLEDAENTTKKARPAQAHDGEAKKTCFCGWLPNLKERYRLGREAKEKVKDIRELIARGQFQKVDFENDPPGLVGGATDLKSLAGDGGDTITDSRASLFQGIMKALDDEKLKVIGVHGPGGIGKSTLLEEVEKKLWKEEKPFKMIAKSTVSQNPDMKKIQYDIAYAFRLNLNDVPSEVGRRDLLKKTIKEYPERVLIILDDLWDTLDLKEVGIPLADESNKCQLLLTSRDRNVLEQKMGAHPTFHLEGLSNEEAFRLFEKTYGPDKLKDEGYEARAAQLVAKLAGLPLLIKSVASTLKCGDESTWDTVLIKIEDPEVNRIVQWSYGRLKSSETESLFLLCGFVGGRIPVQLLLGLGMGLGLFEGFDTKIQSSRNKLNEMLRRLRSICLLLDGDDDEENVTIHDLFGEAVISAPLTGQNSLRSHRNAGSWPEEKLEKCWVCLVNFGSDRLAELTLGWFPDSKIFMLSKQRDKRDCQGLDFASMKELRVLYLRSINFTSFRSSVEILQNLQSLYLVNCDVEDVAILGELKSLQILSFAGSTISSLPKEIGKLTKLKLLNLSDCFRLRKIEPGVLKGLTNLEELYMRRSFNDWMGEDVAKLAELKSSTKLTALEISIPEPTVLLKDGDLPFGNLIRFWINIGKAEMGKFDGLTTMMRKFEGLTTMKLHLRGCDDILSKEWVQKTLQKTQCLLLDGLRDSKKSAHDLCSRGFPKLKHLDIRSCSSIKQIVSSSNGAFPILESLLLTNLINLDKISDGPECFNRLKVIKVTKCDRLEYLGRFAKMHRLAQLEEIVVRNCDLIRPIVVDDERKDTVVADNGVELPNLRRLELAELPKMTSFCVEAGITSDGAPIQVSFPRLESLLMDGLLDWEKILYGQPTSEYSKLKSIEIRESKSTSSSILKSDWIVKLSNLESLTIARSPSAEVVFDLEELKGTGHVEILSRLTELRLDGLLNLQRMCKENAQLKGISVFRKLQKLHVWGTGLAFLFPVSVAKCLGEIRSIEVQFCGKMEALVVDEDGGDEGTNDIIEFPLLKRLCIINCPMMKSFSYVRGKKESVPIALDSQKAYSDSFFDLKVSFPCLESLVMDGLIDWEKILYGQPTSEYSKLKSIEIRESKSTSSSILKSDWIVKLSNLESLTIVRSPSAEVVFDLEELKGMGHVEILSRLTELRLDGLPNLQRMCKENAQLKGISVFRKLQKLYVWGTRLAFLFPVSVAKCLREIRGIYVECCGKMEALVVDEDGRDEGTNDTIEFPLLERLEIIDCLMMKSFSYFRGKKESMPITSNSQDAYSDSFFDPKEKSMLVEIEDCEQMKEVVATEGGGQSKADVLTFPFLMSLSISQCPNFRAFIPNPTSVERPSGKMAKENDELQQLLFSEMVTFSSLNRVKIRGVRVKELWSNQTRDDSFCKLRSLKLMNCYNLQHIAPSHMWKRLQRSLKILEVMSCRSIEIIYEGDATAAETSQLRRLVLHDLENLRHIWRYDSLPDINVPFPNLMDVDVRRCPRLRVLFETFTASFLRQIKWLEVESCDDMELIADHGECEGATCTTITFSELDALKLKELPKFKGYFPEKYHLEFPSHMRAFIRVGCGKEPDQSDNFGWWEFDRDRQRRLAYWG